MLKPGFPVVLLLMLGCSTRLAQPQFGSTEVATTTGTLQISPENTRITFIGSALANSHQGTFQKFKGQLDCPTLNPKDAHLSAQIEMDSVFTKIDLLTKHLKDSDFFDVEKYPTATFISTQIQPGNDGGQIITGNFTLHGVTQTISFPAHFQIQPNSIDLEAKITVRQSNFKMKSARTTTDDVPVTVVTHINRR